MIVYDYDRQERLGMPEAIFCASKSTESLNHIIHEIKTQPEHPMLLTRLNPQQFLELDQDARGALDYDALSQTAILNGRLPARNGKIAIVTAGTSDLNVATEARRTLEFSGFTPTVYADVGVAGIWRLLERIDEIRQHPVIIVVAGMDAAIASVMGGLSGSCLIGVPTSVGYGVAEGGQTALHSMLASCGQGILVTNIDNGFGGACGAIRIFNQFTAQ